MKPIVSQYRGQDFFADEKVFAGAGLGIYKNRSAGDPLVFPSFANQFRNRSSGFRKNIFRVQIIGVCPLEN